MILQLQPSNFINRSNGFQAGTPNPFYVQLRDLRKSTEFTCYFTRVQVETDQGVKVLVDRGHDLDSDAVFVMDDTMETMRLDYGPITKEDAWHLKSMLPLLDGLGIKLEIDGVSILRLDLDLGQKPRGDI